MNSPDLLQAKIPPGPIQEKWETYKRTARLISPANRRNYSILVIGTGLAGASAAASLAEQGYQVGVLCIHDSPRRAHSIAAQGGINAAKNTSNDNDSAWRLFYDTMKGGDFRSREANVYRLAQLSASIIDQCVAQGVPFARDYNGELENRSFGGVQVSRTFYARGQTGQQLLLGAYGALMRQVELGKITLFPRREMLDLVVSHQRVVGVIARNLLTGQLERYPGDAILLATGGYGRIYFLSTNAHNSNGTAIWRCYKRGAYFANPCFTQIHPTCIPVSGDHQSKLTLMSESLRNDGRVWVPTHSEDLHRPPSEIPEDRRNYFLEQKYPSFGNLTPRDVASRAVKETCDAGKGVGPTGRAVYLDFREAIDRVGYEEIREKYGNLFEMYRDLTTENPYEVPMKIYPAIHYTMGGLWVDYSLMSNLKGLFVLGEANFSDHGANRLGASALMQGLADGYFIIPATLPDFLAREGPVDTSSEAPPFRVTENEVRSHLMLLLKRSDQGTRTVMEVYRELGLLLWDQVGMSRNETGLRWTLDQLKHLRAEFTAGIKIGGKEDALNKNLEFACRVSDYLELGELMIWDALHRTESCGAHFRTESQTERGEAKRDDPRFSYVAAWNTGAPTPRPSCIQSPSSLKPSTPRNGVTNEATSMNLVFKIWRQSAPDARGSFTSYYVTDLTPDMSLLEALDLLNDRLTLKNETPIEFDSDCREGICGSCGLMINGQPHGPELGTASCQIYLRQFKEGSHLVIEPWRARSFPVVQDLVVDRSSLDRIIASGGFISASAGPHSDGNTLLVSKDIADSALDAGACIQCGACVAACPNASAALFTGAQISRLAHLPQGQPEAQRRVQRMVNRMDLEGFGQCTNIGECEAACPKKISIQVIATLRREYWKALF